MVDIVGMVDSNGKTIRVLSEEDWQELLDLGMEVEDCPPGQLVIEAVVEPVPEN